MGTDQKTKKVSFYPNIATTTGGTDTSLLDCLEGIKSGKWHLLVEAVRAAKTDIEKRAAKKNLPYFTTSGTFTKRCESGLNQHSGKIALDIDHDLSKREEIAADPYTYAMFVSAGGDGLAVIINIPTTDHKASFRALQRYYMEMYEVKVDSLPDVSRPRFVSYDPDLYINPDSQIFTDLLEEPAKPAPAARPQRNHLTTIAPTSHGHRALADAVQKVLAAPDGTKNHELNKQAYTCGGIIATGLLQESEVIYALENAISSRGNVESLPEAFRTIRAGIKKGKEKPFLPESLEYLARVSRQHGEQKEQVAQKIILSNGGNQETIQQVINEIYEEKAVVLETFWNVVYVEKKDI